MFFNSALIVLLPFLQAQEYKRILLKKMHGIVMAKTLSCLRWDTGCISSSDLVNSAIVFSSPSPLVTWS